MLVKEIKERWPNARLKMQWTLGHEGIEGNKKADLEVKRAAEGEHRNWRVKHQILKNGLPMSNQRLNTTSEQGRRNNMRRNFENH